MTWIKQANKIGGYERSYKGFRIYWQQTDFIKGNIVAIDKYGVKPKQRYLKSKK